MDQKREKWELLTAEDKEFLAPIVKIHAEVRAKYQYASEKNSKALNKLMNRDFSALCEERGIDTERAKTISTLLFNVPWYCYYISDVQAEGGEVESIFSLCTNRYPNKTKKLTRDKFPAFYDAAFSTNTDPDAAYPAILDALFLPHAYKYISVSEYEALATIAEIYAPEEKGAILPRVGGRRIKALDLPLDKPNSHIWNMLSETTGGQLKLHFATEKTGSKKEVSILYSIDFDELKNAKITKALDPFDKRVYIAVAALYNAGNVLITIPQIYNAMGYDGTPGKFDREKINNSITKMSAAKIYVDNAEEISAGYKYPLYQYDGYLLPLERINAYVNGDLVESAIRPFREPPMISLARGRKQITTIDRKLLATPITKSNTNLAIEDYIMSRIIKAKTGKGLKRILYSTIYEEAHLTTAKQRQRAKKPIAQILEYYKGYGFISKYTMDDEGITFSFSAKKLPAKT